MSLKEILSFIAALICFYIGVLIMTRSRRIRTQRLWFVYYNALGNALLLWSLFFLSCSGVVHWSATTQDWIEKGARFSMWGIGGITLYTILKGIPMVGLYADKQKTRAEDTAPVKQEQVPTQQAPTVIHTTAKKEIDGSVLRVRQRH